MRAMVVLMIAACAAGAACDSRDTSFGNGADSCVPPVGATLVNGDQAPDGGTAGYAPCRAPDGSSVLVPFGGGWGTWVCGSCGLGTYASVVCEDGQLACIGGAVAGIKREVVLYCDYTYGSGSCVAKGQ